MNKERFVGLIVILAGMLVSFSRVVLTGAVIGVERSTIAELSGAIVVFIGLIIFALSKRNL